MRVSLTTRNFTGGQSPAMKSGPDVFADALVPGKLSFPERPVPGTIPFPECSPSPELRSPAHQASGSEIFPASYRSFAGVGCFASACCCRRVIAREFGIRLAVNPRMVERSCATPGHLLEPVITRRVTACPVTNSGDPDLAAMVIVLRNRRVNRISRLVTSPCAAGISAIPRSTARCARLHPVHREP